MKYIGIILIFLFVSASASSQGNSPSQLAGKIADKMKDTLGLTIQQRYHIYSINMQLQIPKKNNPGHFYHQDTTASYFKRLESLRDTLYRPILTPSQYRMYLRKKKQLVFNN